jgi:DNA-binding GntR family transcriptional regulator
MIYVSQPAMEDETRPFRTKAQIVTDALQRQIMFGALAPRQRLLLRDVARQFGCSEIPVRDAFRALSAMGLVTLIPHGGAFVAPFDLQELVDLTAVRTLLEPEATCQAAARITPEALEELESLNAEMRRCIDTMHVGEFALLNRRFHSRIIGFAANRHLVEEIETLWDRAQRGRLVYARGLPHLLQSHEQHSAIVALLRSRDIEALRAASAAHSQFGLAAIRELEEFNFDGVNGMSDRTGSLG